MSSPLDEDFHRAAYALIVAVARDDEDGIVAILEDTNPAQLALLLATMLAESMDRAGAGAEATAEKISRILQRPELPGFGDDQV